MPAAFGLVALVALAILWWSFRATRALGGAEKEVEINENRTRLAKEAAEVLAGPIPLGSELRHLLRELAKGEN